MRVVARRFRANRLRASDDLPLFNSAQLRPSGAWATLCGQGKPVVRPEHHRRSAQGTYLEVWLGSCSFGPVATRGSTPGTVRVNVPVICGCSAPIKPCQTPPRTL